MSDQPSASRAPSQPSISSAYTMTKVSRGSGRLYNIPSLENDGLNFQTWKYRTMTVLKVCRLWTIVDGTEAKPDASRPNDLAEWLVKDREARAQITLTLKDEPLSGVLHTTSAAEAWTRLCERYEGKGKQSIAYLIGELFRGTLSDESPMETQLNAMQQKSFVLRSLGQPLDDPLVAMAMVISLPQSYSTLRTILMSANDKLTVDAVINQVLIEEKSRRTRENQSALVAKALDKQKETSKTKDKKRPGSCTYCKIKGHWERECRKKKADKGQRQRLGEQGQQGQA